MIIQCIGYLFGVFLIGVAKLKVNKGYEYGETNY